MRRLRLTCGALLIFAGLALQGRAHALDTVGWWAECAGNELGEG